MSETDGPENFLVRSTKVASCVFSKTRFSHLTSFPLVGWSSLPTPQKQETNKEKTKERKFAFPYENSLS
nr:hypothetical protein CFP56_15982 [Quercus suber]